MSRYKLGLYEKSMPNTLSIEEKLNEAKASGFDYLELSIDETDEKLNRLDWSDEEIQTINEAQHKTGIPIKSICLSGHRKYPLGSMSAETRKQSLEIMEKAISLAAKLGVRIIQIAGYDVYYEEGNEQTKQYFADNLKMSVEMAAEEGVILAFETMETSFLDTVAKAMYWVEMIKSPYLQVYPDVGNITNAALLYGGDPVADLQTGQGHLAAVHLKETVPGVYREVPYGTGHVDFCAVVKEAQRQGVGMFVGEFWHTGEENWREILRENNEFLRKVIQ